MQAVFKEIEGHIIAELNKSSRSIDLCLFFFTSDKIINELVRLSSNDIKVRLVLDKMGYSKLSHSNRAKLNGSMIETRIYSRGGLMHNKYCVIDRSTVITGSYNWTLSANVRNKENIIIVHDDNICQKYIDDVESILLEAKGGRSNKNNGHIRINARNKVFCRFTNFF